MNLFLTCGTGMRIFYSIMLALDSAVYWLVDIVYSLFIVVCNAQIFSAATFEGFANRIYAIIGVVMLFVISVQLLQNIADPDKMKSGETSTANLIKNILVTLILIVVVPTGFKYLYQVQKLVLEENILANIVLGGYDSSIDTSTSISNAGRDMVHTTFFAFMNPAGYMGNNVAGCNNDEENLDYCYIYSQIQDRSSSSYARISYLNIETIRKEIDKGQVEYRWGLSAIAGGFMVWTLLSFTIDMAVRIAKLAYYQLISPIPIVMRIIPKQESVFNNWTKGLLSAYLGVFIRLLIIYFGIYLINLIPGIWKNIVASGGGSSRSIVNVFTVIAISFGILIFMKEAPKLISQMFGLSDGDMSLGIGKKLAGAAVVGGLAAKAGKSTLGRVSGTIGGMSQGAGLKSAWMNQGKAGAKSGGWQFGAGATSAYQMMSGTNDRNARETAAKARARAAQKEDLARKDLSNLQKSFGGAKAYQDFRKKMGSNVKLNEDQAREYTSRLGRFGADAANSYKNEIVNARVDDQIKEYASKASSGNSLDLTELQSAGFSKEEIAALQGASTVFKEQDKRQKGLDDKKSRDEITKALGDFMKNNNVSGPSSGGGTPPPTGGGKK